MEEGKTFYVMSFVIYIHAFWISHTTRDQLIYFNLLDIPFVLCSDRIPMFDLYVGEIELTQLNL